MKTKLLHLSYTLENIDDAAAQFWESLHGYSIFAFSGEMGAGKTTFIHHLCDHLHVQDAVSSPTFALINEYHFHDMGGEDKTIYHLDWYRLKNAEEAINAGMQDCLEQAEKGYAYCFVEWPEIAKELLPETHLWIKIDNKDILEREMEIWLVDNG
jgi:tRNA threonylcarbamoyladenosine biosynthesis protein TsaE